MYERLIGPRLARGQGSVLLLGPRQTGKSTLLRSLSPDLVINLASPAVYRDYVAHPERLEAELRAAASDIKTVFIDEVQRVPALLDVLQVLIDERPKRFRFLLSGSSARKLRRGHANLLPGRIHVHHLHPLVAAELGDDFVLDRVLAHGSLPGVYSEPDDTERAATLRSYADIYLREEIQAEALVRDVGAYARMLDLVAAASGRILNLSALSMDAGIAYETARRYLDVLADTLVAFSVPAWRRSDRARLIAHPKLFLFDTGVRNALLGRPLGAPLTDERGVLLEHLVAFEIHRRIGEAWQAKLFHFRTRHDAEVDFIIEAGRETWAVEVKSSRNVSNRDLTGLRAFAERVSDARKIIVFRGPRRQLLGDVEAIPVEEFLNELPHPR